jgi:hypothetical protein
MAISANLPDRASIRPDTPLRLAVAAAIAFPDGSMIASGLRREAAKGRLVTERIAGKDYVTLAEIENMRALCRVVLSAAGPRAVRPSEASQEDRNRAALAALRLRLAKGTERSETPR